MFETPHGTIQTPAFMNVATCGAIKGAVSALDLKGSNARCSFCNTYHLHLRPGDEIVKQLGGLHRFYPLGRPDSDRQWRLSGLFSGKAAQHPGGGSLFLLTHRRQ